MVAWHLNNADKKLVTQLKARHPGIVIGTIGDAAHSSRDSDHNPDPDGTVDAIDPMIGPHYSRDDANRDVLSIVNSRDKRMHYIIWERRIISSVIDPWVWRHYSSSADPHTGHWHMSTLDKYESSGVEWSIYVPSTVPTIEITGTKPLLKKGMRDQPGAAAHVRRMQKLLQIKADGIFGDDTEKALRKYLGSSYHGTVDMDAWRKLLGLW